MTVKNNTESDLELSKVGIALGDNLFQSFLLAGERYVNLDMRREGTDEAHVAKLLEAIPESKRKLMTGYFHRQKDLDLAQRVKVLGPLTELKISDPLTLEVTTKGLLDRASFRAELIPSGIQANFRLAPTAFRQLEEREPPGTDGYRRLDLKLESLRVEDSQDERHVWPFTFNQVDEVSLATVGIDETGDVTSGYYNLGSIKEGGKKSFNDKTIHWFRITEGGNRFPKAYSVSVYAIERDEGGWNEFLDAAREYAKAKITEELIARGVIAAGEALGVVIPPHVARIIANAVKGFLDNIMDWLARLFTNEDDILGSRTRRATINSYTGNWGSSGTARSSSWNWRFSGEGGRWRTRMHWQLSR
ncbi:hypothetical protein ACPF7Z_12805 [Halomonas sp. GXIMD04776]|uniref:hypothetical protein n=1 Tax=Halomonas sp. GXIMD04776 TaxID=3415605 RepID=UPI003C928694